MRMTGSMRRGLGPLMNGPLPWDEWAERAFRYRPKWWAMTYLGRLCQKGLATVRVDRGVWLAEITPEGHERMTDGQE